MILVQDYLEKEAPSVKQLLQVHDELLFEGPEAEVRRVAPKLAELMGSAMQLDVPLHVDLKIGPNWEDMTKMGDADGPDAEDDDDVASLLGVNA
jgi:DNA polymerase-1